ncbi:hypothetical protein DIPPA_06283 [Diplonema papillatum]|nr:hypothetical protein DIPPA_06289 [Diplonema papillatum]KAJ9463585.1 hypothetical protein DIPPA_06283 [Diplonema papillatum]
MNSKLLPALVLLGIGASVSAGSANDAVINAILDGVIIAVPDTEIPGYGGAENINASHIVVDGVQLEMSNVTSTSGLVSFSASAVNASAELVVFFFGSAYGMKVDVTLRDVSVVAKLSNPEEGIVTADATEVDVMNLALTLSHTCVEGALCELIMAVAYGYLVETEWINVFVEDLVNPLLGNLSLAAAIPYPEPKAVAKEEEKVFADVPDLHNLGSSLLTQGVSLIANGVYGVRQEDGNTALGQLLRNFFPTLYVALNTTLPVVSGGSPGFAIGSLSLGLESVLLTDYAVPSLAVEVVGDYSVALSVTLSKLKGTVAGSLIVADKPNGNADYAGAMVADVKDGAIRLSVSVLVAANETQYATLPLGSLLYPNVGGGQTAEALLAELVRRAMPQAEEAASAGFITQLVQELLMGNPELASIVNCWLQYPLLALKLSTVSVEIVTLELGQFTVDGEDVGLVPKAVDLVRQFLMNGVNYLLRAPIEAVQTEVNTLLQYMTYTSGENPCSSYTTPAPLEAFNYSASPTMGSAATFVNTYIGTKGPWSINAYLDAIAGLNLDAGFNYLHETWFFGDITFEMSNLKFAQQASREWLESMDVLKAKSATELRNEAELDGLDVSIEARLKFYVFWIPIENTVAAKVSLKAIRVLLDVLAEFSPARLLTTPLGHMLSLSTGCLIGSLERLKITYAEFEELLKTSVGVDISCIECTPGVSGLLSVIDLLADFLLDFVDDVIKHGLLSGKLVSGLLEDELSAAQDECTATLAAEGGAAAGSRKSMALSKAAGETEAAAASGAAEKEGKSAGAMTTAKALAMIYSLTGVIVLAFTVHAIWALGTWTRGNADDLPLVLHPSVSGWIRWGVPVFLAATAVVFLTANLLLGAAANAEVAIEATEKRMENLFTYALGSTCRDMWNAEVYYLAVMVAVFSGVWPYVKLSALVWGWVVPPSALSGARRGQLFKALDYTGKWSLMDAMLMILMMASFRVHYVMPTGDVKFFSFDLVVEPGWGVYGFLTGAIMSLVVTHLMVIAHRNAQKHDETNGASSSWFEDADMAKADERVVLATHGWAGATTQQSKMRAGAVIALMLMSLVFLILGATVKTFSFEYEGLAAYALQMSKPGSQRSEFSLLELATSATGQHDVQSYDFGLWYIAVVFVLFTFVAPILQVVGLIALWVAPLTLKEQKYLLFFNEVIAAWCALEVFVFVVVVTAVQIEQFSEYVIGDDCATIDWMLEEYVQPMGYLREIEPTCFRAKAELLAGCWILFWAAVVSVASYLVSWQAAAGVIQHRHSLHEPKTVDSIEEMKEAAPTPESN